KYYWKEHKSACLRALKESKAECRRKKLEPVSATYRALTKGRYEWPSISVFKHHGGFTVMMREAGRAGAIKEAEAEEAKRRSPAAKAAAKRQKQEEKAYSAFTGPVYQLIAEHGPIGVAELAEHLACTQTTIRSRTQLLMKAGRIEHSIPNATGRA